MITVVLEIPLLPPLELDPPLVVILLVAIDKPATKFPLLTDDWMLFSWATAAEDPGAKVVVTMAWTEIEE